MRPVWCRARTELRAYLRRTLGVVLLLGVVSGAVLAIAAGARRTDSAYPRFLRSHKAYDVAVVNYPSDETAVFDFDELADLPMVAEAARAPFEFINIGPGVGAVASMDGRIGRDINRFELLEGRAVDPGRPEEVVISFALAEREGLTVGSRFPFVDPAELERIVADAPPAERAEAQAFVEAVGRVLPDGQLQVVGIEAAPGEFPPQFAGNGLLAHVTPALARELHWGENEVLLVRLKGGRADVAAFGRELERRSGGRFVQKVDQHAHAAAVRRSIRFHVMALWVLAVVAGFTSALVLAQVISRSAFLEANDHPTLSALGMTPGQLAAVGLIRWSAVGLAGGIVGAAVAIAASPIFPIGLARTAEPTPGVALDLTVVGGGVAATLVVVVALASVPALRGARGRIGATRPSRSSRVAGAAARAGLPPTAVCGLRLAFEPGRGPTALPVGTTLAAVTIGVAALVGSLTFGASLSHFLDTPQLYGQRWDRELTDFEASFAAGDLDVVGSQPGVAAAGVGEADNPLQINAVGADGLVLASVKGDVVPPVIGGRHPSGRNEIALGRRTMVKADVDIGDEVDVRLANFGERRRMRVVGQVVLPALSPGAQLGEGALLAPEGGRSLIRDESAGGAAPPFGEGGTVLFVRFEPGSDPGRVTHELGERLGRQLYPLERGAPHDIVNFGRVEATPWLLAAILAALAAATLAHILASAVRRRRRDFAILRALGFQRHQTVAAVVWQATSVVAVALLLGVPLGIAAGGWSWSAFAGLLGILANPRVPFGTTALVLPAAVVLANLVAAIPARLAAGISPALVLRTE